MKTNGKEDPRVKRTRELLLHAFTGILAEKSFHRLTVQDIAERAGVNRVTFYGHFPDKYAILEYWLREQFQQQVVAQCSTTCILSASNLEMLIVSTMRWFAQLHNRAKPDDRQLLPLLFTTMPQELSLLLSRWFKQTPAIELPPHLTPEVILIVMSWTIVGASFEWSDGIRVLSPEEQAKQVTALLMAGFT
jgi:AcrR family transcriptional regulator